MTPPQAERQAESVGVLSRTTTLRTALLPAAFVAASRLTLLFLLGRLSRGTEFTSDVQMHLLMVRRPLDLLPGRTEQFGQHPPLLGVLEALFAYPAQFFVSDFHALRLAFIGYETLAVLFVTLTVYALDMDQR